MTNTKKAIVEATIIDGTGNKPILDGVVIIDGKEIKEIGSKSDIVVSPDMEVINAEGKYLLPGLIDAHVHVFNPGFVPVFPQGSHEAYAGVIAMNNLRSSLQSGVTTIRDLTSGHINLALRSAINRGQMIGPRSLVAGRGICMTGGHGTEGEDGFNTEVHEADGLLEIRKAIRQEVNAGVDLIKVLTSHTREYPEYTQEELNVAVEEAHRFGKKVAAHAGNQIATRMAAIAGVDTIEHGIAIDSETADLMEEKGISLVPTLWVLNDIKAKTEERKENYQRIGEYALYKEKMENTLDQYRVILEQLPKTIELIRKRKINVATGTDNIRWYVPFAMLDQEIKYLTKYGFSNMEAIMAATSGGAKALGLEDKIGTIKENTIADLIMLDNDPLQNIEAVSNVTWVMKEGKVVPLSPEWRKRPVFESGGF